MAVTPVADSVRLALPAEAEPIALAQRRAWNALPESTGQALLDGTGLAEMTRSWELAITRPPDARCRVLVAVEESRVVGFTVTVPTPDPDAEAGAVGSVADLTVDPAARHRGHGSRLLNAGVDTLRADGFRRATIWVPATDDVLRRFLTSSGWAADGAHREVGTEDGEHRLKLVRLHTDLETVDAAADALSRD